MSGMRRSMITTSGRRLSARATADAPSAASPMTRMRGERERASLSPSRTTSWSSAMRQVISSATGRFYGVRRQDPLSQLGRTPSRAQTASASWRGDRRPRLATPRTGGRGRRSPDGLEDRRGASPRAGRHASRTAPRSARPPRASRARGLRGSARARRAAGARRSPRSCVRPRRARRGRPPSAARARRRARGGSAPRRRRRRRRRGEPADGLEPARRRRGARLGRPPDALVQRRQREADLGPCSPPRPRWRTSTSRTTSGPRVTIENGVPLASSSARHARVSRNRPSAGWYGSVAVPSATSSRCHDRRASSRRSTSATFDFTRIERP